MRPEQQDLFLISISPIYLIFSLWWLRKTHAHHIYLIWYLFFFFTVLLFPIFLFVLKHPSGDNNFLQFTFKALSFVRSPHRPTSPPSVPRSEDRRLRLR
jgi:hypothetical protein